MRQSIPLLITLTALGCGQLLQAAKREPITLTFKNDLAVPIEYSQGIRSNPPKTLILNDLAPGESAELKTVDMEQFPQLLFRQKNAKDIAFIYEFTGKPDFIDIHVVEGSEGPKLETTPGKEKIKTGFGRFDKKNISSKNIPLVGTTGRADAIKSEPRPYKLDPAAEAKARAKRMAEGAEKEKFARQLARPKTYKPTAPAA